MRKFYSTSLVAKTLLYSFCFSLALILNIGTGFGQTVSIWTNPITGTNPGLSNPYTTGDVKNVNISVSGIGHGTLNPGATNNDVYNTNGWTNSALDLNRYFNFTLTPAAGYRVSFANFTYTGTGGTKAPGSFAFKTDAGGNNFTTNIGSPNLIGTTIPLTTSPFKNPL